MGVLPPRRLVTPLPWALIAVSGALLGAAIGAFLTDQSSTAQMLMLGAIVLGLGGLGLKWLRRVG
jgi:hypothetical protein